MRCLLLMLATAALGLACKKDPALSNTTENLAPAAAATPAGATVARPALTSPVLASPAVAVPSNVVPAAVAPVGAAASKPVVTAQSPAAGSIHAADSIATDEGNGEPMDDVDDEVVPVTDKSGVDNTETEDGPSGPVDEDSEGADIDLRE